jgi:hypothetical protein
MKRRNIFPDDSAEMDNAIIGFEEDEVSPAVQVEEYDAIAYDSEEDMYAI